MSLIKTFWNKFLSLMGLVWWSVLISCFLLFFQCVCDVKHNTRKKKQTGKTCVLATGKDWITHLLGGFPSFKLNACTCRFWCSLVFQRSSSCQHYNIWTKTSKLDVTNQDSPFYTDAQQVLRKKLDVKSKKHQSSRPTVVSIDQNMVQP